jgi:glycosyltransferase involved in cell wall biosynthesis
MKLCWLVPDDRSGGVASVAQACCQKAAQFGHEVTLLLVLFPVGRIQDSPDFQVDSLQLTGLAQDTPKALLDWLQANPQDILFLNGCEQADAVIAYLPNDLYCVYVVHDTAPRYWKTAVQEEHHLDRIVAVSESVSQQFKFQLQDSKKLLTILNGCNFPKLPAQNDKRANNLIFLGGDKPIKGAFDVLKIWRQLIQMGFIGQLHWFGSLSSAFQKQIIQLPASDCIHLYGQASRDLIFDKAAAAKILLMLSRVEPFGMATIEAMSMGCLPVAWDIETGTKEIIGNSNTGIFIPLGNTKLLARKVIEILENYAGFEGTLIHYARTHFEASVMGQKYEDLIYQITAQPPAQRRQTGQAPPTYQAPVRRFQQIPLPLRLAIRTFVGRSPRLGYWLRDLRGF